MVMLLISISFPLFTSSQVASAAPVLKEVLGSSCAEQDRYESRLIEAEVVRKIGGITAEELEVLRNMAPTTQSMNTASIESEESVVWNEK